MEQLTKPLDEGGHQAFHLDFGAGNGPVPVNRKNHDDYHPDGAEPEGLEVSIVDSGGNLELDEALLGRWLGESMELQLNGQVRLKLEEEMEKDAGSTPGDAAPELSWEKRAWPVLRRLVREAVLLERAQGRRSAKAKGEALPTPAAMQHKLQSSRWLRSPCPGLPRRR